MPRTNGRRIEKVKPTGSNPVPPPAIAGLLRELDGVLERIADEGTKCADVQDAPRHSDLALLAARWITTQHILEMQSACKGPGVLPNETSRRVENAWSRAMIEAETATGSNSSVMGGIADDPLAEIAEEIATYRAHLSNMMPEHEREFVLIKRAEIIGFFTNESSALQEGYRRFGRSPFLVKEVAFPEPVIYLPNVVP